jgi:hypothetical protein
MDDYNRGRSFEISIPRIFAVDHDERDLPTGLELKSGPRVITYLCDEAEIREWRSDAVHYSDCGGFGWDMDQPFAGQLKRSALATIRRIDAKYPWAAAFWWRPQWERDWFYGHGGTVAAYVERYGSANDANHHGEGGEAIFAADWAALERARKALANAGKR